MNSTSTQSYSPGCAAPIATVLVATVLIATVLALSLWTVPAWAQYPSLEGPPSIEKTGERDVAIVVAVEEYLLLPNVPGAKRNATDWENFFRRGLGLSQVHVLVDAEATREEMLAFARRAAEDAREGATVWFVFIGHGSPTKDGKDGMLVGADAQQTVRSLQARSLVQGDLLKVLEGGKQSQTVLVVDACFSGRSSEGDALAVGAQPVIPVIKPQVPQSVVVFSAARADEFAGALPGEERPAFSYLLLGALRGWAGDGNKNVTASEALLFTRQALRGVRGRNQTPELFGDGNLVLTRGATEPDPGLAALLGGRLPVAEVQPEVRVAGDGPCPDGRLRGPDTAGNCCWPGQAWNGSQCVGEPTACAYPRYPAADECLELACPTAMARQADGVNCCWPNQAYSSTRNTCLGTPACPQGTRADNDGGCTPERPVDWYGAACNAGDAHGCFELAGLHARGVGVTKSMAAAARLREQACNGGHGDACRLLAMNYSTGWGVKKSVPRFEEVIQRATGLLSSACDAGHVRSCVGEAQILITKGGAFIVTSSSKTSPEDVSAEKKRARELLRRACDASIASACAMLGATFGKYLGFDFDLNTAFRWTKRGCDLGDQSACKDLVQYYQEGRGVTRNLNAAKHIAETICADNAKDCRLLASVLEAQANEKGSDELHARARAHYLQTCNGGDWHSCGHLAKLHDKERNFDRAVEFYEKTCTGPQNYGCHELISFGYRLLRANSPDRKNARRAYKYACNMGYKSACNANLDSPTRPTWPP